MSKGNYGPSLKILDIIIEIKRVYYAMFKFQKRIYVIEIYIIMIFIGEEEM